MIENVNYSFYLNVLQRKAIPDGYEFDKLSVLNIAYFESLYNVYSITEHSKDGIASAICMMCEVDYLAQMAMTGEENSSRVSSSSVGGVSESYDKTYANAVIASNVRPIQAQKIDYIKMFCRVYCGVG